MQANSVINNLSHIHNKQPWLVINAAQKFSLVKSKHPDISHFYTFKASAAKQTPVAVPDGCIDLLFDCDSDNPNGDVYGTPLEAMEVNLITDHRYFGVRYQSGVMPDFFNISAGDLTDNHYSLNDLIPNSNQLLEQVTTENNFLMQVNAFHQFMNEQMQRKHSPITTNIINEICKRQGNVKIKELEKTTGFSLRTLQRKFQDDMGMSPKTYSRIVRCQSAIYKINHDEKMTFLDLAFDLGFADQPHFLKEFKKLVSTTPLHYQDKVKHESYLKKIDYI
ncbi:helix-turn-helix domain-containing protein [Psychromonas sp. PT13]|uniref:helix-turn-helix domain-containing protein n=1 Tax=Psychromonas sp. PT13 TaxID=3439547 RepID=UPI003EBBFD6E